MSKFVKSSRNSRARLDSKSTKWEMSKSFEQNCFVKCSRISAIEVNCEWSVEYPNFLAKLHCEWTKRWEMLNCSKTAMCTVKRERRSKSLQWVNKSEKRAILQQFSPVSERRRERSRVFTAKLNCECNVQSFCKAVLWVSISEKRAKLLQQTELWVNKSEKDRTL